VGLPRQNEGLVADAAGANAPAAAVEHDREALVTQPNNFSSAQGGVLRSRLGLREVAILNVRGPGADRRLDYVRTRGLSRKRAGVANRRNRQDLDQAGRQRHASQGVARQVSVDGESGQTIRRVQAAAALGHFLLRIEHKDVRADIARSRAWIGNPKRSIRSAGGVGIREIVHFQDIGYAGWRCHC